MFKTWVGAQPQGLFLFFGIPLAWQQALQGQVWGQTSNILGTLQLQQGNDTHHAALWPPNWPVNTR